jgi:hypothetical protein
MAEPTTGPPRTAGQRLAFSGLAERTRLARTVWLSLALGTSLGGAEGTFQVRYFAPAMPWVSGFSADLSLRGALLGGQADASVSLSGLDTLNFGLTYNRERTVLLAQYSRALRLAPGGSTEDANLLIFAQQGFDAPERGLRQLSLTALNVVGATPESAFRLASADLSAGGALTRDWTWTASSGVSRTDTAFSLEASTPPTPQSQALAFRVRAGLSGSWAEPCGPSCWGFRLPGTAPRTSRSLRVRRRPRRSLHASR